MTDSKNWKIKITVWAGTSQKECFAQSYEEAMKIVEKYHRNSYDPVFEDRNGNTLVDCGHCFCYAP
jgi:hypothetical protein